MKIALAQLNYHIGNFEINLKKIVEAISRARDSKADIVVFAELAVCGYPPRDLLEFRDFVDECRKCIDTIAKETGDIAVIVGTPSVNPDAKGKRLFNSAFFISGKKIVSVHHKTLLPTYDIFDENRYFESNDKFITAEYNGCKIAITVCEDLWHIADEQMYKHCPMDELAAQNPNVIINISASPFDYEHAETRKKIFSRNALKYGKPLLFVNHVGAQTELIFDGGSMAFDKHGKMVDTMKYFEEDFAVYELYHDKLLKINKANIKAVEKSKVELIHDALILGIRDYFKKLSFTKAIVGLSGGIDSAVTLALAAGALGKENVKAVLLPSVYSSEHSITDAKQLARAIGCSYDNINISGVVDEFQETLQLLFKGTVPGIAEENIQARSRAVILMALANKFDYILLNTSNKSEAAVGYGTLYGDMCGGLSVLGDVYKTEVYELAHFINRKTEIIPDNTIKKNPSAELKPNQKDTDSLPEYVILDKILYQYIEKRKSPDDIISMGFDTELVKDVLKKVNTSEWKRYQTPPALRVSPKAFGMGRRLPIVAKYLA